MINNSPIKNNKFSDLNKIPIIFFIPDTLSVLIIFLNNMALPKIGQMLTSVIIDYVYLNIFSTGKVIECSLFIIGITLNAKFDEKYKQKQLKLCNT